MTTHPGRITPLAVAVMLTACTVGPDYVRPSAEAPVAYKELEGWKVAQPSDHLDRGQWWEIFGDPQLNALIERVEISNQNIQVAEAQFRQAQALVLQARAGYFPTLTIGALTTRSQAPNLPNAPTVSTPVSTYNLPLNASWEPDLWGSVRRSVESNEAGAQASAANLASARLSAQATLAQNYFQLRAVDAETQLLDSTVEAYARSLQLTRNRYAAGVAARTDVAQAETQLKSTQAQAIELGVQRAQIEHAIAVLVGTPPAMFSISVAPLTATPPPIPVGVPSELLERRPDIASAERTVAAANAQIGVAIAAFYPSLTLSAAAGFRSALLGDWFTAPSRYWSLGAAAAQLVFDGGLRSAVTEQARANYDATIASYRQTVLTGFQEVEDNLAALRILESEAQVQDEAVQAAEQALALTLNQYKAGTVSYLDVVVTQAVALNNKRTAVDILSRRMVAAVLLVKGLGGGWSVGDLSSRDQVATRDAMPDSASDHKPQTAASSFNSWSRARAAREDRD